jgi:hypothetical protein
MNNYIGGAFLNESSFVIEAHLSSIKAKNLKSKRIFYLFQETVNLYHIRMI